MSVENIAELLPPEIMATLNKNNEGKESLGKLLDAYHGVKTYEEKTHEHLCKTLICLGTSCASAVILPGAGFVFLPEFLRQLSLEIRNSKILSRFEIEYNEALGTVLSFIPEEELSKLSN